MFNFSSLHYISILTDTCLLPHTTPFDASVLHLCFSQKNHYSFGSRSPADRHVKWPFLQLPSFKGCDVVPLCHFQCSFVLALYSHFSNASGDLVSGFRLLSMNNGTACVFPCLLPCCSLDPSFRQANQCRMIFSAHPPSYCFSCFSKQHKWGLAPATLLWCHLLTLALCCPFLPVDILACFRSIIFTSSATCPTKWQGVHLMPKSRVPHMTAPASLSPVSMSAPRRSASSTLFVAPSSFSRPHTLHPKERCHGGQFLLSSWLFLSVRSVEAPIPSFPAAAAIYFLNFSLCRRGANGLSSRHSRKDQAHTQQLPLTNPHAVLLEHSFFS